MVLKFDFSSITIPEGSEISEAKLHLYNFSDINNFLNPPKKVFHINSEWKEDSVTFYTQPDLNWEKGSEAFQGLMFNTWETIDMRDIARDLIYGDSINKGFAVSIFDYNYGGCQYYSSECENQELRPKMELLISDNLSPVLELLTLNGEEDVEAGTEELVKWNASDDGSIQSVVVHYNIDNEWILLDSVTDGTSEIVWKIPIYDYRKRCFFRLTAYDNTGKSSVDFSDEAFIIEKPTSVVAKSQGFVDSYRVEKSGSALRFVNRANHEGTLSVFDLRGQLLHSISLSASQKEYLLPNLNSNQLLLFRIRDIDGERTIKYMP